MLTDTIIAISSPPAAPNSLRAIIRLSGDHAWHLAREITSLPATATTGHHPIQIPLPNNSASLPAAALLFQAPKSFTGQHLAELHLPNSPALLQFTLASLLTAATRLNLPARLAHPGEFTARAFFNAKLDLTQAEGIAATINASNELELRAAASLREGDLHREMDLLAERAASLLALIEAGIDFSDEEGISFVHVDKAASSLEQLGEHIEMLLITSVRVDRLAALPSVVFIGKPNVGKSSLINALCGHDRSIVSPVAGTTRDQLSVTMRTSTGDIRLIDVPGEEIPSDELRGKMMDARRIALDEADLVVRVIDHTGSPTLAVEGWPDIPAELIVVQNKCDLIALGEIIEGPSFGPGQMRGAVSALTGENISKLREVITRHASRKESISKGRIAMNQRHRLFLQEAKATFWRAARHCMDSDTFRSHPELLAAELRHALNLLGQITGTISPDEVLGRIFSTFCIGK